MMSCNLKVNGVFLNQGGFILSTSTVIVSFRCQEKISPEKTPREGSGVGLVRLGIALGLGSGGGGGFRGDFFLETLFPKIDELRNIAKLSNVAAIDVSELKLDDSFLSIEINNDNYNTFRCDRNRYRAGVLFIYIILR